MFICLVFEENKTDKIVKIKRLPLYHLKVSLTKKGIHVLSLLSKPFCLYLCPSQQNSILDS